MSLVPASFKKDPSLGLICLGLWMLPVSNAAGQVPLYLASVIWLVNALRGKEPVCWRTQGFLLAFSGVILISLFYAVHPENVLSKLNRFLIFPLAGAVTSACLRGSSPRERIFTITFSLLAGVCLRGLYDLVKFPMEVHVHDVKFEHVGNMTSPQFYLVAILLLLGLRAFRPGLLGYWFWLCLPLLLCGFLLHQKRGVWLAGIAAIGLWTLWMRHWKILISAALLAGFALCLPFVQTRLGRLNEVVDPAHGGRSTLWVHVAPELLPRYPWGMGYNGSNHEDFKEALNGEVHLEEGLNHLHNNLLQIRLELGWHGVVLWTAWMASVLWVSFRKRPLQDAPLRHAVGFALLALMLNGMVEHNFGDSEILKLWLVLFGLVDVFVIASAADTGDEKNLRRPQASGGI